jgi:hypothetical protein
MSATTSVPQIQFGPNGFIAPPQSAIFTGLEADYNAAFGGNLNPALTTPQGQLETTQSAVIGDNYDQQTLLFNSVDPAFATGRLQDAIARIYFLDRNPAEPTTLQVICGGLPGVVIPAGTSPALITDPSGNVYGCTEAGTIGIGGTVTLTFACLTTGPIAVPETVSIYQAIPNWNTATVSGGVEGVNVESAAAFEARRAACVALNAIGVLSAIRGVVLAVPGVLDAYVTENDTGSSVTTGGVTLAANSLYVCVFGGASQAIANAIWSKKNPGCAYTGNTTETVYDSQSGYAEPYPSYSVTFQIATPTAMCVNVLIKNSTQVPANSALLVSNAVLSGFSGADGGTAATIGSTIYASRYYGDVATLGVWAQVIDIQIGTNQSPDVAFTAGISGTTMTVSAIADATFTGTGSGVNLTVTAVTGTIYPGYALSGTGVTAGTTIVSQTSGTVGGAGIYVTSQATTSSSNSLTAIGVLAPGQFVYGVGVASGSIIVSQLSGSTGSTGTYKLAVSQTVGSEAMTGVTANNNVITMNINAVPTLAGADVNTILV